MDYSDYEGAEIILDPNNIVLQEYHEKFDVVFDGGTCEHVFNVPNF